MATFMESITFESDVGEMIILSGDCIDERAMKCSSRRFPVIQNIMYLVNEHQH